MGNTISRDYSRFNGSGRELEEDILYRVNWGADAHRTGYKDFRNAMSIAKRNQPGNWRPADPPTRIANDMHYKTSEVLGMECSELRLYTALGSSLDRDHGIDAWFEFDDELAENGTEIVTLDLTRDPNKYLNGHKADVIAFGTNTDVVAEDVAKVLDRRYAAVA